MRRTLTIGLTAFAVALGCSGIAGADGPNPEQVLLVVNHDEQRIAQLETEVHTGLPVQANAQDLSVPTELRSLERRVARLERHRRRGTDG